MIAGRRWFFWRHLFFIQIVQHDRYVRDANAMRVKQYELLAKRGEVYFMDGKDNVSPAIMNERTWTIFVDPNFIIKNAGSNGVLRKKKFRKN